jgi:hypothetical protein
MAKAPPTEQEIDAHRRELLTRHASVITPFLTEGEALRGVIVADISSAKKPPARYTRQGGGLDRVLDQANRAQNILDFGVSNALWGAVDRISRTPAAMKGDWDSHAGQFILTVSAAAHAEHDTLRHFALAFASGRVLMFTRPPRFGVRQIRLIGQFAPGVIALPAGWHPAAKSAAALDFTFPDGSYVAVGTPSPADTALLARLLAAGRG